MLLCDWHIIYFSLQISICTPTVDGFEMNTATQWVDRCHSIMLSCDMYHVPMWYLSCSLYRSVSARLRWTALRWKPPHSGWTDVSVSCCNVTRIMFPCDTYHVPMWHVSLFPGDTYHVPRWHVSCSHVTRIMFPCDTYHCSQVTRIMFPCDTYHVPMWHVSCSNVTRIMFPCDTYHVPMWHVSCSHVTRIMFPCDTYHVPMWQVSYSHVTCIMFPCETYHVLYTDQYLHAYGGRFWDDHCHTVGRQMSKGCLPWCWEFQTAGNYPCMKKCHEDIHM